MVKKFKLLLVDDNIFNLQLIEVFSNKCGYNYDSALNGHLALDLFKSNQYDLILMDIRMPTINGMETTMIIREIEKKENRKYTPIIAVSAQIKESCYQECLNAGMNDYLSKPFTYTEFKKTIETILKN
jgi:CheY-like chemotaxis protein